VNGGRGITLPIWVECYTNFNASAISEAGLDVDDVFFRGLAYRVTWMLRWHPKQKVVTWKYDRADDSGRPTDWQLSVFKAFGEVNDLMRNREILPKEKGVIYRSDGKRVLWAFQNFTLPLEGPTPIRDVLAGTATDTESALAAKKHRVYVIG